MPPRFLRRLALPVLLTIQSFAFGSAEPRTRVLIVDGFSNHDWQLTTALIRGILEPTGLFDVSVSTAPPAKDSPGWDEWRPRFADYDVVIQTCNDIWGGPPWPRAVQEDFENFVRDGGGVYVWHSGNNAFADWPAYNEMIGLGWRVKDFGPAIAVEADGTLTRIPAGEGRDTGHGDRLDTVVHRLGDHPIHAGMPRAWKTPDIEVYYYARGPAKDIEVLSHGFDPVTQMNWPLEWTVRYGEGRVYISTFGHVWKGDTQPERMRCAGLQTVVVRALQWLAGRPADFPVPPDFPTGDKIAVRGEIPIPNAPAIATAPAPDQNFNIFLCLGQSNMEGFPGIPEEDRAFADPRFQVLAAVDFPKLDRTKGNWYVATPPLCRPNSGLGPADYFGRTLLEHLPADARVGIVNVSVAGARIEVYDDAARDAYLANAPDWMRGIVAAYGGSPYRRLVATAKRAQRAGVIRGILLHQGEANTNDPEWPAKVKLVYENLLRDLDLRAADVPLLAGELVGADQNGACASMNTIIARLPDTIPTAHVVSSAGCAARDDRLHFKPEGYRELGRRFAHAMLPLLGIPGAGSSSSVKAPAPLYLDPAQPQAARIRDLISRMTLEEKAAMMSNSTPGIPRLGIPKYDWWSEALHGVANSGTATVFPQAIGLAAMWNEELQREMAGVIGIEGRAKFNGYVGTPQEGAIFRGLTFWSPNINIFRDPRWGRGQETYGEDPFLTSRLGVAFVRGLQGDHPDYLLAAACAKHYAVHSGPEPLRHNFNVSPSDADLFETYLPAFEALVREARVEAVMTAYNALNGTPASISPLLYSLLESWDFDGHVVSDCGSVDDLHRTYKAAADPVEANALTLRAGMNLRCGNESAALATAVRRGLVTEGELDDRLASLLRTMFRLGFFDPKDKVPFRNIAPTENDTPAHGALALRAARESMVLLKNDGILPLDTKRLKRVAVIGPNATSVPALLGNYNGSPSAPVTLLAGLKAALEPAGVQVDYAHGCDYALRPTEVRLLACGWVHGEYFANADLAGEPLAKRTERPLNSDWGDSRRFFGGRPEGVPEHGISALWNGNLETTLAGDYELVVRGRGGFRLWIDGEAVIDSWNPPPGEEGAERRVSVTRHLPDNAVLPLRLEYKQGDGPLKVAVDWNTPAAGAGVAAAIETARDADVIVFIGGISAQLEGEEMNVDYEGFKGGDRLAIELPEIQQELLKQLHATGKPIVFVNLSGSAVAFPWADENVNAIPQAWYPGQAGGTAVADVLLGNYNPAGRLPVTFYRATADMPDFKNYNMDGRTYRYFDGEALYAFGHGLSYSHFRYDNLRATPAADGTVAMTLDVTNTGDRDGDEVVQLYATPPASSNPRERHALCGFDRIHLKAGETKRVSLTVPSTALRRWSKPQGYYAVPTGVWKIGAGASSSDIRLTADVSL
jgi:beta-glucosidase